MIVGSGHDHTLDWWALGILMYEMIIGIPPFYNKNKHQMYQYIQYAPIRWPDKERHGLSVSEEAKDLITRVSQTSSYKYSYLIKTESKGLGRRMTWMRSWAILSSRVWTGKSYCRSKLSLRSALKLRTAET